MIVRTLTPHAVEAQAPAKLNLFLEVLNKRADGYHEIESLMVAIDLYDTLTFVDNPSGEIRLLTDDPSLPTGSENLVVRAAERLRAERGVPFGADIELRKRIPSQAGLGGGSSDAAATLVALDRLWNLNTPRETLHALAGEIGSDVAFFLQGPAAICRGRGERVDAVPLKNRYHFVLVCPAVGVRTASVYGHVSVPDRSRPIGPILDAMASGDPSSLGRSLFNRLQPVAERLVPDLIEVRDALQHLGPLLDGSLMSGSGSAYFGLARDQNAARDAARQLENLDLGRVRVVTCGP